jgi:hypothetical protein
MLNPFWRQYAVTKTVGAETPQLEQRPPGGRTVRAPQAARLDRTKTTRRDICPSRDGSARSRALLAHLVVHGT